MTEQNFNRIDLKKIELLSPAKDAQCGIEAINHGADAVYIGAPHFSARAAASNSIEDIETLINHAHKYYAKVYVALNTILDDRELEETEKIIRQLYNIGTDALIVQDMGITQLDLPPITLHASTQMDNRTVEKVQFLEKAGFSQVVLARELSFHQIKEIAKNTSAKLEVFLHGALCVSYSGQCYISQATCGRSANKGNCAQLCRLPYSLLDANDKVLVKDKHLLSLQDMNLSEHLKELIEAGVSSLKIEGRLKETSYVKNVTAYYRQKLDNIFEGTEYQKSSSGRCTYTFMPDLSKSFHRGGCTYFTQGRQANITAFDTPKSTGEYIGTVQESRSNQITVKTDKALANGDGFCFLDKKGVFSGFKANRIENKLIFPANEVSIPFGTDLYRNFDQAFEKVLAKKSADRKIDIEFEIKETETGFDIKVTDEDGNAASLNTTFTKEPAQNKENADNQIRSQFKKTGNTIFESKNIIIDTKETYFIPAGQMAEWRRTLLEKLENERLANYPFERQAFPETSHPYITDSVDYHANIHNKKAEIFYEKHGVTHTEPSFEKQAREEAVLMTCKHCLRFSLGLCPKNKTNHLAYKEPLYLANESNGKKYRLKFDCKRCEMLVIG